MNILFHIINFKPNSGGIAEYTHQIACHLQSMGENVVVLSGEVKKASHFDSTCQYKIIRYNFRKLLSKNWLYSRYSLLKRVLSVIKENDIDILIGRAIHRDNIAAKIIGLPHCVFIHGLDVNTRIITKTKINFLPPYLKEQIELLFSLKGPDKLFTNSSFTKKIVENLGVPERKTSILYPGISKDFLEGATNVNTTSVINLKRKLGIENRKIVLTLSRIIKRKGIDKTIQAIKRVKQKIPEVIYVVAGKGPYSSKLKNRVDDLKLNDYVMFIGYVPEEDKHLYYAMADIFVMPNRELPSGDVEGFGIVFLEANVHEKPVVGGNSGGAADAVIDGETGLLVDPLDTKEIANAIIALFTNDKFAHKLGKQGRKRVKTKFQWNQIVLKLQKELHQLLGNY